jgi:hypothetical protein
VGFSAPQPFGNMLLTEHRYLDYNDAKSAGLISTSPTSAKMGVDSTNKYTSSDQGRPSVRIETKKSYTHGLFIADIQHMPGSICGMNWTPITQRSKLT